MPELAEFRAHEMQHRDIFWGELKARKVARCRSYYFCGLGGYILGLITGLLGRSAILATTVAVERVVLHHLELQITALQGKDEKAIVAIQKIIDDEKEHHDRSLEKIQRSSFYVKLLTPVVSASTETVIWFGMRL